MQGILEAVAIDRSLARSGSHREVRCAISTASKLRGITRKASNAVDSHEISLAIREALRAVTRPWRLCKCRWISRPCRGCIKSVLSRHVCCLNTTEQTLRADKPKNYTSISYTLSCHTDIGISPLFHCSTFHHAPSQEHPIFCLPSGAVRIIALVKASRSPPGRCSPRGKT